ncbi:hypothetical protein KNSL1_009052 [Colletotrichum chrysophilum]|nr:hypothetical protein KNSL1_009052 [Colletotrichum chrysophilum]
MATHQNTFSVISNGAPGGAPSRPPMTSKQAQKLYKQANKVPRRSKAEQRKWEKERQEEIKKELERERAAVKAKQARDRKKAKEEEARENRRRQGQPLVDCRPSQDTIARFAPSPQELSPQRPPPSTQAIIQDCFDDVFLTASQLALELEDDEPDENSQAFAQSSLKEYESPRFTSLENSLPERTQRHEISRNRIPQPKPPAAAKPVFDDFFPLICTQDLMMSSQEVLEIESPAKVDSEPSSGGSLGGPEYQPSPLIEMDLAAIDWDDDLDDF